MMRGAGASRARCKAAGDDRPPRRMLTTLRAARTKAAIPPRRLPAPQHVHDGEPVLRVRLCDLRHARERARQADARSTTFATAAVFIGVAAIVDMLDGRIARMTGTTSEFGMELDSLADIVSFGLAPAILAFAWGLEPLGRLGWAGAFLYVTCAALRLARFNIQAGSVDKRYFVGMPSPAAAAVVATTVFFWPEGLRGYPQFVRARRAGARAGARLPDGQHDSLPRLQVGRRRPAPPVPQPAAASPSSSSRLPCEPQAVLIGMAYSYLLWAFIGHRYTRLRKRAARASETAHPGAPADDASDTKARRWHTAGNAAGDTRAVVLLRRPSKPDHLWHRWRASRDGYYSTAVCASTIAAIGFSLRPVLLAVRTAGNQILTVVPLPRSLSTSTRP